MHASTQPHAQARRDGQAVVIPATSNARALELLDTRPPLVILR
jgi:hypothetical protein